LPNRDGSILRISLRGTNKEKDADFINTHIAGFQAISLEKKNLEAQRQIQFIDDQLVGISDSLITTENNLQKFRSTHRVMDLSAQGQALIGQVTLLENERARLDLEANYYAYLADYLSKDISNELPIVPITMGISDPGLTRLVEELAELQGQLISKAAGAMNPLQRNLEQRVENAKDALRETLNGLRRANSLARSENEQSISRANAQASALPVTERQLIGIERKFRLNDELYTFLLETRAEQELQKASNKSDSEIIDPADIRFSLLVSPRTQIVYIFSSFLGLVLPLVLLLLGRLLNNKILIEDVKKLTNIPLVGSIPHSDNKSSTVVIDLPNSLIAESFRLLRSRMQFFTKEAKAPVILVTSVMPAEGKTFTSINLASVYSLLGKKTVLVGFDLRKPKISENFNLCNERGVSTWLIGKDSLQDIIQETNYDNLSVISAGPIPPNPSELTALGKAEELFMLLRERFNYVIIDSSPIGIVSDTFSLASFADALILVVRPGHTRRDLFVNTMIEIKNSNMHSLSLVINDIKLNSNSYGYIEKYGYTKEVNSSRKKESRKKRILLSFLF
jgi:capsular exopolysaccharide synthesis family protein